MGLHQHKVALLVPVDSLLCYISPNIFRVIRNTRTFSSGRSNAILWFVQVWWSLIDSIWNLMIAGNVTAQLEFVTCNLQTAFRKKPQFERLHDVCGLRNLNAGTNNTIYVSLTGLKTAVFGQKIWSVDRYLNNFIHKNSKWRRNLLRSFQSVLGRPRCFWSILQWTCWNCDCVAFSFWNIVKKTWWIKLTGIF